MKRKALVVLVLLLALGVAAFAQEGTAYAGAPQDGVHVEAESDAPPAPWKYVAAAIAVGLSCIGGGMAVGRVGAAAMGAISENPDLSGKAMPYAGLAEGICLWGFLVALLILFL
ncbi:MAG: ATP synthase subunit C [Treponema sp.]|jgi:V/A-type H+-transporting ATPase subunit K|nr:ATP synthase subunit C [Treponema sp.]